MAKKTTITTRTVYPSVVQDIKDAAKVLPAEKQGDYIKEATERALANSNTTYKTVMESD